MDNSKKTGLPTSSTPAWTTLRVAHIHNRVAAEFLAGMLKAELIELVEKGERKGFAGFIKSGYQAASRKKSELQGELWKNATKHEKLHLLTPIWGGSITPAMNAFLGHADFEGREVTVITFQADSKGSGSEKVIYLMQGIMKADHKFYKRHKVYDFPQKQRLQILKMQFLGLLISIPWMQKKMKGKMARFIIKPYEKVIEAAVPANNH